MTMPASVASARIDLPPPQYPMLVLLITDHLTEINGPCIRWVISERHPFVEGLRVTRMFVDRGGVDIYSTSGDGSGCLRDHVPVSRVRLTQEAMPIDVFVDELAAAESGDADEDEGEEPEPEQVDLDQARAQSNGQVAP